MAWIGGAIAAAGAIVGNKQRSDAAGGLNEQQMAWQQHMRDTAYPATLQSMKAAGLNPMLAYSQGALQTGNFSPVMPQLDNIGAAGVTGYNQAATGQQAQQQAAAVEQEMQTFEERFQKIKWETLRAGYEQYSAKYKSEIDYQKERNAAEAAAAEAQILVHKAKLLGLDIPEAVSKAAMWASEYGKALPYVQTGVDSAAKAAGALNPFRRR